jgi:hypothetical protein
MKASILLFRSVLRRYVRKPKRGVLVPEDGKAQYTRKRGSVCREKNNLKQHIFWVF